MSKRRSKAVAIVLVCILAVLLIWNLIEHAEFNDEELSCLDSWRVRTLLMLKETDFIEYGCPFLEDYSIKPGGLTYCLGQDDCNTVYIPELDFYYEILGNTAHLHELLQKCR